MKGATLSGEFVEMIYKKVLKVIMFVQNIYVRIRTCRCVCVYMCTCMGQR